MIPIPAGLRAELDTWRESDPLRYLAPILRQSGIAVILRSMRAPLDSNDCDASIDVMATITIRDLEPGIKERLRVRAARNGRSMEEEVRVILRSAIAEACVTHTRLAASIRRRFKGCPVQLELPDREPMRQPPKPR